MASPDTIDSNASAQAEAAALPADQAALWKVALRDIAILSGALSLFAAADLWRASTGLALAGMLSVVDGLLVGLATGALVHEWGHYIGARLAGAAAPLRPMKGMLPLFDFDYAASKPNEFMGLSIGGNVGHWLVVVLFAVALPLDSPGQVALVSAAMGFAVFSSSVEFPVILRAWEGGTAIESLGVIPKDFVRRYGRFALLATAATFVIL